MTQLDLNWQKKLLNGCRRGNAEVEELLRPYVLCIDSEAVANQFEDFLEENDQHLFEWLLNPQQAPEKYAELIDHIRSHYLKVTSSV